VAVASSDPVRLPKKAEVVARHIAALIFEQRLEPGTALPNEPDMLAQFRVARSTLREALRLLETQGVLSLQAGRSPMVRQPTPDDLVNSLTLLLQFQGATFETLLVARAMFEPVIAAEAARRGDAESIAELRRNVHDARLDSSATVLTRARRELDFHRLIAQSSGNPLANVVVATLTSIVANEFIDPDVDHDFDHELNVHEAIIDAIEAGDASLAHKLMSDHLDGLVATVRSDHPAILRRSVRWM
jgi:DNA-binding FadR family transcriptional regulator